MPKLFNEVEDALDLIGLLARPFPELGGEAPVKAALPPLLEFSYMLFKYFEISAGSQTYS